MRIVVIAASLAIACGAAPPLVEEAPRAEVAPVDPDGDGLTTDDVCPCAAEDEDGFDDHDGCPDLDDDHDGIVDACDVCPREAESPNGLEDDDGCPDVATVRVTESRIEIVEQIRFERDEASLGEAARAVVEAIARVLLENPHILRLRLVGHADARERRSDGLSLRRAETVRDALVALGVAPERLLVEGRGAAPMPGYAPPELMRSVTYEIVELAELSPPPAPAPRPPCVVPEPPRWCDEGPSAAAPISR